jgi:MFS family permease
MMAYAAAMAFDGVVALVIGPLFDRQRRAGRSGGRVLAGFLVLAAGYGYLALVAESRVAIVLGIASWSIGRAATDSVAKALIAVNVPAASRGRAYGIYYVVFGAAWWLGSVALGYLYDRVSVQAAAALAAAALLAGAAVVVAATETAGVRRQHPASAT